MRLGVNVEGGRSGQGLAGVSVLCSLPFPRGPKRRRASLQVDDLRRRHYEAKLEAVQTRCSNSSRKCVISVSWSCPSSQSRLPVAHGIRRKPSTNRSCRNRTALFRLIRPRLGPFERLSHGRKCLRMSLKTCDYHLERYLRLRERTHTPEYVRFLDSRGFLCDFERISIDMDGMVNTHREEWTRFTLSICVEEFLFFSNVGMRRNDIHASRRMEQGTFVIKNLPPLEHCNRVSSDYAPQSVRSDARSSESKLHG